MANTKCDTLYDSDTNDRVSAEELGLTDDEYEFAVSESVSIGQMEGHVRVYGTNCGPKGRRVYAA